ncbi:hypothetical protein Tco_1429807 [Tanacetum coccineum]
MGIAGTRGREWETNQMDVKSAFSCMALLMKEVYVSLPPGFVDPDHPTTECNWLKLCKDCTKALELDTQEIDLVKCKAAITPMETSCLLTKIGEAFDVTPKTSHLNAVKRIFKVPFKRQPNLDMESYGITTIEFWEAFSDSDMVVPT